MVCLFSFSFFSVKPENIVIPCDKYWLIFLLVLDQYDHSSLKVTHDKRLYGTGTSRGLCRSEICLRAKFPVSVREQGTNLYVGKCGFSLVHPYVQPPLHSQSPCVNLNGNADVCYVCGDWLVCQTISVCICNNPVACILRLARNVIRTAILDRAMEHWTPWVDQGRVRLSAEPAFCAFSNTLCGMSHGDQHRPLVSVP